MLIGIDPLLGPELLFGLRAMGHGDEIALVDGNYPALEHARRLVRADGHQLIPVLNAILSVMPLDYPLLDSVFVPDIEDKGSRPAVHGDVAETVRVRSGNVPVVPLASPEFYDRVRAAHLVVATSEARLYGNVILRKGVVAPG